MKKIMLIILMLAGFSMAHDRIYYAQKNKAIMTAAMNYLNSSDFLPANGVKNGKIIPDQTMLWTTNITETVDGWYCIPKIPNKSLDALGVPEEDRTNFVSSFSITILTNPVMVTVNEDI